MKSSKVLAREIRDLSNKGLDLIDSPGPFAAKKAQLEAMDKTVRDLMAEREQVLFVEAQRKAFHQQTGVHMDDLGAEVSNYRGFGRLASSKSSAPSVRLDDQELEQLFEAGKTKSRTRVELKAATGLVAPPVLLPGVQPFRQEATRIADILPSQASPAPSIEYLRHVGNTGAVAVVAAGGVKPDISPSFETVTISAIKVAGLCKVKDEFFDDFAQFSGLIVDILEQSYEAAENEQLLLGTGAADGQIQGLLTDPDVLTRVRGADSALDALELAGEDLRIGPAFCEPTAYVLHPSTFGVIRRAKDLQGRYLLAQDPTAVGPSSLWGRPVILTTQMPAGKAIALNTELAAMLYVRHGVVIDTSNAPGFATNETSFRIEARLNLGIVRPKAIVVITGLDAP